MSAHVHGWRRYTVVRCSKVEEGQLVLRGSYGKHVHENPAPHAECRGFAPGMWMTPGAQTQQTKPVEERRHDSLEAPMFECTCGYYGYRTLQAVVRDGGMRGAEVVAHVTAIEKVILHQEGFRAQMYHLDYLLAPEDPEQEMTVLTGVPSAAGAYYWPQGDYIKVGVVLEEIAARLGVSILAKDDLAGCPSCLEVNGLRRPEEISDKMRREWFGEPHQ